MERLHVLGCEDPLKKGMATHSSILARRIPWTEEPVLSSYTVHEFSKNQTQLSDFHFHFSLSYIDLSGVVLQKKNSPQVISHEEI